MTQAKTVQLNNFSIRDLLDKYGNQYFVIVNNDNSDEGYFCFQKTVEEGWDILSSNPTTIELEYEENEWAGKTYKRVINLYVSQKENFLT